MAHPKVPDKEKTKPAAVPMWAFDAKKANGFKTMGDLFRAMRARIQLLESRMPAVAEAAGDTEKKSAIYEDEHECVESGQIHRFAEIACYDSVLEYLRVKGIIEQTEGIQDL